MLEQGIITESQNPWRSPIVAVLKPDGAFCLCIDFQKLNAISWFYAFPMPEVSELLERIG